MVGRLGQERAQFEPLVDRLPACAGRGRQLAGQFDGSVVVVDVDHHPAGNEVLGLGERAVGDRRATLTVVPDEGALRSESLTVDELAGLLEPIREVAACTSRGP